MAITSADGFFAASKQWVRYTKIQTRTAIAASPFSVFDLNGNPGGGTLAVGNTANGVFPTNAINGYPKINDFGASNTGYLYRANIASSVACRIEIYDTLFSCGAYAFNTNTTLASQPSYAGRVPTDSNYQNTLILFEAVTAFTGNPSLNITYLNESGASKSTGTIAFGFAPTVGRHFIMPLQAGDKGVSQVNNITATVATAGTFNIHVVRLIAFARVNIANDAVVQNLFTTTTPEIYQSSALRYVVYPDSTSTGIPDITLVIANG